MWISHKVPYLFHHLLSQDVGLTIACSGCKADCKQTVGLELPTGRAAMDENSDRQELEKQLEQSRQLAADQPDPVVQGWLFTLVRDLERRLQDQQQ